MINPMMTREEIESIEMVGRITKAQIKTLCATALYYMDKVENSTTIDVPDDMIDIPTYPGNPGIKPDYSALDGGDIFETND
jgi:hypothetical protein